MMPKIYPLYNITLPATRLWYAGIGIFVVVLGLFATSVLPITTALLLLGILAIVLVGLLLRAGVDEKAFKNRDTIRQGYVERFGPDSRQVRLYDEVQQDMVRQGFKSVRLWFILPYAGLFVVTTIIGSFRQISLADESSLRSSIVPTISLALFVLLNIIIARRQDLQLGYHKGYISKAMWRQDYNKAMRYADEMVRRNPTPEAKLEVAYIALLTNDAPKIEQYATDALSTLTSQTNPKNQRRQQEQISYGQSLLGVVRIFQQRYTEAESLELQAIQSDPSNILALSSYAEILLLQGGRWEEALEVVQKLEAVRSKEKYAPFASQAILTAWTFHLRGQYEPVDGLIQEAFVIADAKQPLIVSETHYLHGLMRESIGEEEAARLAFIQAQKTDPTSVYGQLAAKKLSEF